MAQYTRSINEKFLNNKLAVGWPWRMFIFTSVMFLAAVFTYLGLAFIYKPYLQNSLSDAESKLSNLSLQISPESQKNFMRFYSQVSNLRSLLAKHITTSKLFPLLEASTHQKVVYSSTTFVSEERALRIEVFAESYEVLAAQLTLFEQAPWVKKVVLDNSSLSGKTIKFGARLTVKNEAINL